MICDIKVNKANIRTCADIESLKQAERCAPWYLSSQSCKYRMYGKLNIVGFVIVSYFMCHSGIILSTYKLLLFVKFKS